MVYVYENKISCPMFFGEYGYATSFYVSVLEYYMGPAIL